MPPPIGIQNISTVCSDDEVRHWVAAIQIFMPEFCAAWGLEPVDVGFLPSGQTIANGMWLQVIADDSDQANALGYHETTREGIPIGYTFAKTDLRYGSLVSVTLTHELFEQLGDPMVDRVVEAPDGRRYMFENADAVEADDFAIEVAMPTGPPVRVSDFVLPAYFDFQAPHGVAYDFAGHLTKPIPAMLHGGYLAFQNADGTWGQTHADMAPLARGRARPHVLSRRYKRMFREWLPISPTEAP